MENLKSKIPKGRLLIVGGAEYKSDEGEYSGAENKNMYFKSIEILSELFPKSGAKKPRVEIITTASESPADVETVYSEMSEDISLNMGFLKIANKTDANDLRIIQRIQKADAVFFTGGDQLRLTSIIGGTETQNIILNRYYSEKEFIAAGTSAGAMAMATLMIYDGNSNEAVLKGDVKITSGLGFIEYCIIDTHFITRCRFGRLAQAILMNPSCMGIGLGEDTALIIKKGNEAECIGSGMVTIIDGKEIRHTNIAYAEENEALCIENLQVHILAEGNGILVKERKFIPSKRYIKKEKLAKY